MVATVVNLYTCCVPAVLKEADVQAWFQSLEVFASIFAVIFYVWFHSEAELESLIVISAHTSKWEVQSFTLTISNNDDYMENMKKWWFDICDLEIDHILYCLLRKNGQKVYA